MSSIFGLDTPDDRSIFILPTIYWISFSADFDSVATIADADLTTGGATYTKEDVLGRGLYNIGADTLTYAGGGTWLVSPGSPSVFIDTIFKAHAIADPNVSNDAGSTDAHGYECREFLQTIKKSIYRKYT